MNQSGAGMVHAVDGATATFLLGNVTKAVEGAPYNGKAYFAAAVTSNTNWGLYSYDGYEVVREADITVAYTQYPAALQTHPSSFLVSGGTLYFTAGSSLWGYDGDTLTRLTAAGSPQVSKEIVALNGDVYMTIRDASQYQLARYNSGGSPTILTTPSPWMTPLVATDHHVWFNMRYSSGSSGGVYSFDGLTLVERLSDRTTFLPATPTTIPSDDGIYVASTHMDEGASHTAMHYFAGPSATPHIVYDDFGNQPRHFTVGGNDAYWDSGWVWDFDEGRSRAHIMRSVAGAPPASAGEYTASRYGGRMPVFLDGRMYTTDDDPNSSGDTVYELVSGVLAPRHDGRMHQEDPLIATANSVWFSGYVTVPASRKPVYVIEPGGNAERLMRGSTHLLTAEASTGSTSGYIGSLP